MTAPRRCPKCDRRVDPNANFCPICGASLHTPDTESTEAESVAPSSRRGCRAAVVSFLLVILVGGGALAAWWYLDRYEPEKIVVTQSLRDAANSYDVLGEFYHGVAQCRRGNSIFYIDTHGNLVDAPDGSSTGHMPDETTLIRIEKGGRWGMIDRETRDTVIRPIYSTLGNLYDGFALASLKFGDPTMPEYCCYYGYVDAYGNHTFTPDCFDKIESAASRAQRREYIQSLPKGFTAKSMGLPEDTRAVIITREDSPERWILTFNPRGVLLTIACDTPEGSPVAYGVTDGFITSATIHDDGVIRSCRYLREKINDSRETIVCQSSSGRRNAGNVVYSTDDGTVVSWTFETLPSITDPGVTYTLNP